MVDVESYCIDGADDFNQFSCGACGRYHDTEEEAEKCCKEFSSEDSSEELTREETLTKSIMDDMFHSNRKEWNSELSRVTDEKERKRYKQIQEGY